MIDKMLGHMHWANATARTWIEAERKDSRELIRLASHILNAERIWICRGEGTEHERDTFIVRGFAEMAAMNDENHARLKALAQGDLKRVIDYRMLEGTPMRSSLEDMILHAFSHGFHHMGQMAALASASGGRFPNVSFIGFTRKG